MANTNALEQITQNVVPTVTTNLNQVLIEILSGVKSAGGEVFVASKDAVRKSVDFVSEQAPDVVREFCVWRFWESVIMAGFYIGLAVVLFFLFRYLSKKAAEAVKKCDSYDAGGFEFLTVLLLALSIIVPCLFLGVGGLSNVKNAVQVKVAPKVYIIEYVVDLAKSHNPNSN